MIVTFQARLSDELQSQIQEDASSDVEIDKHAITRNVLGEQCGHIRGVGRKLKGIGNSTSSTAVSHAHFAPGSSSFSLSYEELAVVSADSVGTRA